jgi:hypothetical protein
MCVTVNVIMPVAVQAVSNCNISVRMCVYSTEKGVYRKKMAAQFF